MVYGVFLVLVGTLAVGLSLLVGAHVSAAAISTTVAHDRALIRLWADGNLTPSDLRPDGVPTRRTAELEGQLDALSERGEILRIEVRHPDGTVLLSNEAGMTGQEGPTSASFSAAAEGRPAAAMLEAGAATEAVGGGLGGPLIREYLPILQTNGEVAAVVGLWRDASPMLARLDATRRDVLLLTTIGAVVMAAVLLVVFRAAQGRLTRQSQALVEATRRDPLTGLLNHGAVVARLAEQVEIARLAHAQVGIALIDIDNFRLLNDTHGHAAGDAVLRQVTQGLDVVASAGTLIGRYGPDEFVVIGPPMAVEVVKTVVVNLQAFLGEVDVQFGDSEVLPITVSAGLATFPDSADAVTDLLMAATAAVGEAKSSGGDAIRSADSRDEARPTVGTFSVLQGLVLAIDTKDRYTKRHSEDVARYALFLGGRLGLEPEELELLRVAGLLHDVGKVGIPDDLLRKPGRLTPEEQEVFHQHVVLGDLIVRDLPQLDGVRAGVRHHHERWDGAGYVDHLAGAEIPLVARILAVGDAFSAMTTTRPYRKGLSVEEALKRLGGVAGTQLEERLVSAFITGMLNAHDAPLPGDEQVRPRLWTPRPEGA